MVWTGSEKGRGVTTVGEGSVVGAGTRDFWIQE